MSTDLFRGSLVRLTAEDPKTLAEAWSRWGRDSLYTRLLDSEPALLYSEKRLRERLDKDLEKEPTEPGFGIRTMTDDKLIGFVVAWGLSWHNGDTFFGIGIGDSGAWGKGYGTDALRLFLRYAFLVMNLRRVSLNVFSYNPRAIRCYEKCGFRHEGRLRGFVAREGTRADAIYMGILRQEWEALNPGHAPPTS